MKPENQVIIFEISQRLAKLGVKQDSLFWYDDEGNLSIGFKKRYGNTGYPELMSKEEYPTILPAYTVAELGEMINRHINFISGKGLDSEKEFYCTQISLPEFEKWSDRFVESDTEANARGLMLCYLIENNIITV